MSTKISGSKYAAMYGPTTGDKVRLADTSLVIEVEKDYTTYGDEVKFGGGKTIRDGMGQSVKTCNKDGDLDLVITNALIVDSTGIIKADIGIKDGKIAGIGKAGNPDIMDGVTPGMTRSAIRTRGVLSRKPPAPEPHRPTRAANAPIPPPEAGVRRREARSAWL